MKKSKMRRNYATIGRTKLRKWRKDARVTLRQAAELFSLPSGACHVAHLEAGRTIPSLASAVRIEEATYGAVTCRDWVTAP